METCLNYTDETMYVSSDQRKIINRIHALHEENPDKVIIMLEPEENDGAIYAKMPSEFFILRAPRKLDLTDEQRQELRDRMLEARKKANE